jgi:hypothetical protein
MPYNADGSKKANPTTQEWQAYHLRNGTKKPERGQRVKTSASNTGGGSVGGGSSAASAS